MLNNWWEKDNTHRFDGKRVRIKAAQSCYKKYDIVGDLGTVINWLSFDGKAAIQIDDKFNNAATKGYSKVSMREHDNGDMINPAKFYDTTVTCSHAKRCDGIMRYLDKTLKDVNNIASDTK